MKLCVYMGSCACNFMQKKAATKKTATYFFIFTLLIKLFILPQHLPNDSNSSNSFLLRLIGIRHAFPFCTIFKHRINTPYIIILLQRFALVEIILSIVLPVPAFVRRPLGIKAC